MHLVGFSSNTCITLHGINNAKLQYSGFGIVKLQTCMEKRAGLNQFIAYSGRTQRHTHAHTHTHKHTLKTPCMTTALVHLKVSNSRRYMNCSSICSLAGSSCFSVKNILAVCT